MVLESLDHPTCIRTDCLLKCTLNVRGSHDLGSAPASPVS